MSSLLKGISKRDRFFIVVVLLIILGCLYKWLFYDAIEERIENEKSQQQSLQMEMDITRSNIAGLLRMQEELELLGDELPQMPSYSAVSSEGNFISTLSGYATDYNHAFTDLTRDGNLIRRGFTLTFKTRTYDNVKFILEQLSKYKNRCLVNEVKCAEGRAQVKATEESEEEEEVVIYSITIKGTFYETMYEGKADALLPPDVPSSGS